MAKGLGIGCTYGIACMSWALVFWYAGVFIRNGQTGGGKAFTAIFSAIVGGMSLGQSFSNLGAFSKGKSAGYKLERFKSWGFQKVVHVMETTGKYSENQTPSSYISLFSPTPGKLTKEIAHIEEGFVCGKEKVQDFVTFTVNYGCWSTDDTDNGWSKTDIPTLDIESDTKEDRRMTHVLVDTRWSLAINTQEIEDFTLEGKHRLVKKYGLLIPEGGNTGVDRSHVIQFLGGQNAPKKFNMNLFWRQTSPDSISKADGLEKNRNLLLKLRTYVDRLTPKTDRVLKKLSPWCSIFGKFISPHTLALRVSTEEIPFTYMSSLQLRWTDMKDDMPFVQGKIKCFLTCVKGNGFQF
ncbi:hypothetical protein GIB67_010014 [Kingdonia uniflora]|uniref:ABC transmembrane type-1 domain-containing protein n=1 Tax=Kingdonia uniflora TaxID=39325 RepID=A0A7J7KV32_9MAGN|nr:hypothetical protein GIB67_010014 [Kingdonia uniflora]